LTLKKQRDTIRDEQTSKRRRGGMKLRIAIWAGIGALVSGCWGLYFATADKGNPIQPIVYALFVLTQPAIGAIVSSLKFPVGLHSFIVANAATYALAGTIVETTRRHYKQARLISN
jgi:hypothetical protein